MHRRRLLTTLLAGAALACVSACAVNHDAPPAARSTTRTHIAVDSARMLRVIGALAHDSMGGRAIGSPGGARARALLVDELRRRGIAPLGSGYVHELTVRVSGGDRTGGNVLGVIRGTRNPGRYLIASAHYDHLGTRNGTIYNGADDNASGTAALLELASWFAADPPTNSVIIALFDGEEVGMRGARAFLEAAPVPIDAIVLNVNLDMVGRNEHGELYVAGTARYPQLRPLVEAVAARSELRLIPGHDTGTGRQDWTHASDHAAFHARGIPFLYFGVEDHADYHRPTDDVAGIDAAFIARAARTIIDAVRSADASL